MTRTNAVVLDEWGGDLSVEQVERPDPGPGEVRVEVHACAVTRTIENAIQGGLSDDPGLTPRIPGHEFAGVVDAVGEGVSLDVGDRILAYFYLVCGACDHCRRGAANRCTEFGGWYGVNCDGAYAEYAILPEANALPLPDGAGFAAGAVAADGLATPLHVCERTGVDDTDTVLVVGAAGRIGVHLSQLAARRGAHVVAADVAPERLAHVDDATPRTVTPVDASSEEFVDRVREATPYGSGPTVVVDTVGDVGTLRDAFESMAMGGQVVSLTTHHDRVFDAPMTDYVVKEASFLGSRYATKDEVVRAARLFADGRIDPVVRRRVGLDEVPAVHRELRTGETFGTTVVEP